MKPSHASFATSWETAYLLAGQPSPGKCFYLVQDLESLFYPASSAAILAENTYSFGFHGITAGRWLPTILGERYGMAAEGFDFGSDVDLYTRLGRQRKGVAFFARPSAPRRAFELGAMALEVFAKLHPETTIHLYGDSVAGMPFPFVNHGHVTPAKLNQIYNECFAGLSLSMTNVSLVPHEMLASGCIPVVNDAPHNRVVLDNPYVRYGAPNPHDLARALSRVVAEPKFEDLSGLAAASVVGASWEAAGAVVEAVLRRLLTTTAAVEGTVPVDDQSG